jgi:DNA-binding PadR family transcriptional regulator
MPPKAFLGEFEQMVLLAVARLGPQAYGPDISGELERSAGRSVSRGALYTTFDRLKAKGLLVWSVEPGDDSRSGLPKRLFAVTPAGVTALRTSRRALLNLWAGLDEVLEESPQ